MSGAADPRNPPTARIAPFPATLTPQPQLTKSALLPAHRRLLSRAQLTHVPVTPIIKHLKSLIVRSIGFSVPAREIDSSGELNLEVLRPLIQHCRDLENSACVYSLLYLCRLFKEQAVEDSGAKELWRTRADVCEIVAVRLLKWFEDAQLLTVLFGEFSPKQAGRLPPLGRSKAAGEQFPSVPSASTPSAQDPGSAPSSAQQPNVSTSSLEPSVPIVGGPSITAEPIASASFDSGIMEGSQIAAEQEDDPAAAAESAEDLIDILERRAEDLGVLDNTQDEVEPYGLEVLEEDSDSDGEEGKTAASVFGGDSESVIEGTAGLWGQNEELVAKRDAKESALAIAVDARCLRLTAHPWVVELVEEVWNGRILFVRDDEHEQPPEDDSPRELIEIEENPEPTLRQLFTFKAIFDPARLRVPRWQYWVRVIHFALLLLFFSLVLHVRSYTITWYEVVFYVIAGSYILDELDQISDSGIRFYLLDVWTYLDLAIIVFFIAFFVLRVLSFKYPPPPEPPVPIDPEDPSTGVYPPVVQGLEFTILGFSSVFVWPRFLASLDRIQIFGIFTIVCREMLLDSLFFIIPCVFMLMGFTSALYSVVQTFARYDATIPYFKVMGDMAQVFVGLFWNSYDYAVEEGFPGYALFYIVLFVGVVNNLLMPFLIAIVTNSFMRVYERADAEYEFDLTCELFVLSLVRFERGQEGANLIHLSFPRLAVRVLESTLWQDEHCFLPPFNIILPFLYPFRLVLPTKAYRFFERFIFFTLCWPMMLLVWVLEVLARIFTLLVGSGEEETVKAGKLEKELVAALDGERREITRLEAPLADKTTSKQSHKQSDSKDDIPPSVTHKTPGSPRRKSEGQDEQTRLVMLLEVLAARVEELGGKLDEANARIEELTRVTR